MGMSFIDHVSGIPSYWDDSPPLFFLIDQRWDVSGSVLARDLGEHITVVCRRADVGAKEQL